jgi:hypothetical protein
MALPIRPPAASQPGGVYGPPLSPQLGNPQNPWTTDILTGQKVPPAATKQAQHLDNTAGWTVSNKQHLLYKLGYNVAQDGMNGPQTQTAWKAYKNGVHPGAWNEAWAAHHRAQRPATTTPHDTAGAAPSPVDQAPPPGVPDRQTAGANPMGKLDMAGLSHLIDPIAYAKAATDAKYNPRINEMLRQMGQDRNQQGQDQTDIANWYTALGNQAGAAHTDDLAAEKSLLGGSDTALAGLVNSLGGSSSPAAAMAAAQGTIGRNELSGLASNHESNLTQRGTDFANAGVGQRLLSLKDYEANRKTAQGDLSDLRGQKADDYTTALDSAYNLRGTQEKNLMNAKITAALAGPQLKSALLANKSAKLNYDINNWRYQMGIKQANEGGNASSVPPFEKQAPADLNKLSNMLLAGALGPRGNFNQNPSDLYQKMSQTLSSLSYGKWDPASNSSAKNFVMGVINAHLSAWNRQNPQNKYKVAGGQIVHTK